MADEKKKTPEEEEQKETPVTEDKPCDPPKEEKPEENPVQTEDPAPSEDQKKEDPEPEEPEEKEDPDLESMEDPKDKEILRLKTQISAMQLGIKSDCVEDAVAMAEMLVATGKSESVEAALSAVVKKYPTMKGDGAKKPGGFKVGAGSSDGSDKADNSRLSNAFGIKKKQ